MIKLGCFLAVIWLFSGCAVQSRYGIYKKTICEENRYGDIICDNGYEYYRQYDIESVYDR